MNGNSTIKPSQKFPRNSKALLDNIFGTVVYVNDETGMVRLEKNNWKAKVHYTQLETAKERLDSLFTKQD